MPNNLIFHEVENGGDLILGVEQNSLFGMELQASVTLIQKNFTAVLTLECVWLNVLTGDKLTSRMTKKQMKQKVH